MARSTVVVNFSAPPSMAKQIAKEAKKEKKSKSEFLRDAFKSYLYEEKFRELQLVGKALAEKYGLETYDDIEEFCG